MDNPHRLYELLLDYTSPEPLVDRLTIGLVWTVCQTRDGMATGLAMSPGQATRTLPWSGSLRGKSLRSLASRIMEWEPYQATVAMAAINCSLNARPLPDSVALGTLADNPNLAVFEHFLPQLQGKKVVVIGHYPGIEIYREHVAMTVLERQPQAGDLPDTAAEYLLPQADWVFLTASSIPNKTFPRLAQLAAGAKTVLMGPTTPWLPQLHEFGIDYLAGVEVVDAQQLYDTAAQGGGVRIFNNGLRYRVAELSPFLSMAWLKREIADRYADKARLTTAMEHWYGAGNATRFADYPLLEQAGACLSRLDSSYKLLWDRYGRE